MLTSSDDRWNQPTGYLPPVRDAGPSTDAWQTGGWDAGSGTGAVPTYRRRVNTPLAWAVLWFGLALVPMVIALDAWSGPLNPNEGAVLGLGGTRGGFLPLGDFGPARIGVALLSVTPFFLATQIGARWAVGRVFAVLASAVAVVCFYVVPLRAVSGTWWVPAVADVVLFTGWLLARARSWPAYLTLLPAAGVAVLWNGPWSATRDLRLLWHHLPYRSGTLTLWWVYLSEFVALGLVGLLAAGLGNGRRAREARESVTRRPY